MNKDLKRPVLVTDITGMTIKLPFNEAIGFPFAIRYQEIEEELTFNKILYYK